jgi:hypothetical protein
MPRKLISECEAEIARLAAKNEALEAELEAMKAHEARETAHDAVNAKTPVKRPPPESKGTTIHFPAPGTTLILPSDDELHLLENIVLAAYPILAPPIELSFQQRLTHRNHPSLDIKPDTVAIHASFFREFKNAFIAIGSMKRMDGPDRRHYVSFHAEAAQSWLRSHGLFHDITTGALLAAALAHGDVFYTDGTIDGSLWELGLSVYVGTVAKAAWRRVLAAGKVLPAAALPPNRRMAAASPARVY